MNVYYVLMSWLFMDGLYDYGRWIVYVELKF